MCTWGFVAWAEIHDFDIIAGVIALLGLVIDTHLILDFIKFLECNSFKNVIFPESFIQIHQSPIQGV